jgi:quercetin dioxygenase-like cupin family protein
MTSGVIRQRGEVEMIGNPLGGSVTLLLRGADTGGAFTALETVVPPGEGPPLHVHGNEDETMYVLAGTLRFKLGDELRTAPPGSLIFIPRGTHHTFHVVGEEPARMLVHFNPSGMERFFESFAALESPDPGAFARVGAEAGMTVVGPPLAESDPV